MRRILVLVLTTIHLLNGCQPMLVTPPTAVPASPTLSPVPRVPSPFIPSNYLEIGKLETDHARALPLATILSSAPEPWSVMDAAARRVQVVKWFEEATTADSPGSGSRLTVFDVEEGPPPTELGMRAYMLAWGLLADILACRPVLEEALDASTDVEMSRMAYALCVDQMIGEFSQRDVQHRNPVTADGTSRIEDAKGESLRTFVEEAGAWFSEPEYVARLEYISLAVVKGADFGVPYLAALIPMALSDCTTLVRRQQETRAQIEIDLDRQAFALCYQEFMDESELIRVFSKLP